MLKRTLTGIFLLGFLILVLYLSSFSKFVFDGIILIFSALALYEMYSAMKRLDYHPSGIAFIVLVVAIYPLAYFFNYTGLLFAFLLAFLTAFVVYIFNTKKTFKDFILTIVLCVYPMLLLGLSFVMNNLYGMIPSLFALSAALMCDTLAYYGGSFWGKKKIFPKISPKKTYVGSIIGIFGGALGGLVIYALFEVLHFPSHIVFTFSSISKYPYLYYIIIGMGMAVASEIGDLAASRIKREVGLKDYGSLMGAHGGVMDRIDSVLFSLAIMSAIMFFVF